MRLSPWRLLAPRCDRSAPAQKAGDAPVTTMSPMSGSPSMASKVATISSTRSRVRALRRAGASRVTTATRSTVSVRSSGMAGSLALGGRDVRGDAGRLGKITRRRADVTGLSRSRYILMSLPGWESRRSRRHRLGSHLTLARHISRPLGAAFTTAAVAALAASGMALAPAATQAGPAQQSPPNAHGDLGPAGGVSIDVEVFKGEETDVIATLDELDDNVHKQLAEVERARAGLASAKAGVERADAALAATQARIDDLVALSDEVVVDAFINPPSDDAIDALTGDSVADASLKASIVDLQTDADAAVLEELHAAQSELKARKGEQDEAAATADAKAASSAAALTDLESAQSQQAAFVLEVQDRLDRKLSEAEALAKIDPALAAQLEAEQGAIAARLEAIRRDDAQREVVVALQQERAEAAARQAAEAQAAAQAAAAAQPGGMGPAR